jgi:hypothetical protein
VWLTPGLGCSLDILDLDAAFLAQVLSRLLDVAQKVRVVFELLIEPVIRDTRLISNPAGFPLQVKPISSPSGPIRCDADVPRRGRASRRNTGLARGPASCQCFS